MTAELNISDKAARQVQALMAKRETAAAGIRLYTKAAGCSGLKYVLDFVETPNEDDLAIDVAGVTLFVDKDSWPYLKGLRMDWKEDRFETGFVFENPNAKALCGCGESFMV